MKKEEEVEIPQWTFIPQLPEGLQQACFWKFLPYPNRVKLQNKPLPPLSHHSWVCILHSFCFIIYLCVLS